MPDRLQDPIGTYPETTRLDGPMERSHWRVRPSALTPAGARFCDRAVHYASIAAGGYLVFTLLVPFQHDVDHWIAAVVLFYIGRTALRSFLVSLLTQTRNTEIAGDTFRIHRMSGWKEYDLNRPHSFSVMPHVAAVEEARQIDYEVRKAASSGHTARKTFYYGDSFHIVFIYDGHTVKLFDVYGRDRAEAIVNRYMYIVRERAAEVKRFGDAAGNPHAGREWPKSPGGLSDA